MTILKKYWVAILLLLIIISLNFYWFQWRTSSIRQHCAWTHKYQKATPAISGRTIEDIKRDCDAMQERDSQGNLNYNKVAMCNNVRPVVPKEAQPDKDWWSAATDQEYNLCLRQKGIK